VGVTKAAIHYTSQAKVTWAGSLSRYRTTFSNQLARIKERAVEPRHKLEMYVQLYASVLRDNEQMCLCGMLAADFLTLPDEVRAEVQGFCRQRSGLQTCWLRDLVQNPGRLAPLQTAAQLLLSGLEVPCWWHITFGDVARFERSRNNCWMRFW